jgi:DNA modification methylase
VHIFHLLPIYINPFFRKSLVSSTQKRQHQKERRSANMPATRANLQIQTAAVREYENNARTHSSDQIEQIAASIKEYGFTNPILIDEDDRLIAGHGRLVAAKSLGLAELPAVRLSGLSEAQRRALILADNKLALNAGWDMDKLAEELRDLTALKFDLNFTGFSDNEIGKILDLDIKSGEEDEVPEPPAAPRAKLGDLWICGKHRVICGDSTDPATVERLLSGAKPHLMVTDPPYGVNYDPSTRSDNKLKQGAVLNDDRADWTEAWKLFSGDVAYVWHASMFTDVVIASLEKCGLKRRSNIIWNKDRFAMGRADYHWKHEPCWYAVREGKTGHYNGDRKQTTVWDIPAREDKGHGHCTQKPVECMRRPMINNSERGDAVYDPFLGSGSTLIAAETCERVCYGVELNPAYVDIIVTRWQNLTGQKAVNENGESFDADQ